MTITTAPGWEDRPMADAGNSNHISDIVVGPSPIRLDAYRLIVGRALGTSRWFVMD